MLESSLLWYTDLRGTRRISLDLRVYVASGATTIPTLNAWGHFLGLSTSFAQIVVAFWCSLSVAFALPQFTTSSKFDGYGTLSPDVVTKLLEGGVGRKH